MKLFDRIREIARNLSVEPHGSVKPKSGQVAAPKVVQEVAQVPKPALPSGIKAANEAINAREEVLGELVRMAQEAGDYDLPPVTHRRTSKAGIDLMHQFEGCELKRPDGRFEAYLCPAKVWTIGWGSTGKDPFNGGMIGSGTVWTQEQCDQRFAAHLATFEEGVRDGIGKAPTTQAQFDAMVCLAYNIGVGAFQRSTVLRRHVAGDYAGAAAAFAMWNKGGGKVLKGLVRRREAEAKLYRGEA